MLPLADNYLFFYQLVFSFRDPAFQYIIHLRLFFGNHIAAYFLISINQRYRLINPSDNRQPLCRDQIDRQYQIRKCRHNQHFIRRGSFGTSQYNRSTGRAVPYRQPLRNPLSSPTAAHNPSCFSSFSSILRVDKSNRKQIIDIVVII